MARLTVGLVLVTALLLLSSHVGRSDANIDKSNANFTATTYYTYSVVFNPIKTLYITNLLGPSTVYVQYATDNIDITVSWYAQDNATLQDILLQQPSVPTLTNATTLKLDLAGAGNVDGLGAICEEVPFTLSSPRPPCAPWTFTSPPAGFTPYTGPGRGAVVAVSVPPSVTRVCINTWCADPLWYSLPGTSPAGFEDIGNNVIYDSIQGLMWQKYLLPKDYPDPPNHDAFGVINNATADCKASNVGGFSDWRLPTRAEAHMLMDHGRARPALNTNFFPDDGNFSSYGFWTTIRSRVNDYYGIFFVIYGGDGGITYSSDIEVGSKQQKARCVRTAVNKVANPSHWHVLSDDSALDEHTGLVWERDPSKTVYAAGDPFSAINHCQGLEKDGFSDWELPTNKELVSFMDEARAGPAWNTSVFPSFSFQGTTWFWCRNRWFADGGNYWGWSGSDGVNYVNVSPGYGRCVRYPTRDQLNRAEVTNLTSSGSTLSSSLYALSMWIMAALW